MKVERRLCLRLCWRYKNLLTLLICAVLIILNIEWFTCSVNVALCTNPWKQIIEMRRDGRPQRFRSQSTTRPFVNTQCNGVPMLDMEHVRDLTQAKHYYEGRRVPKLMIMLASQKSGSTWVQQKLDSNPDIMVVGERFLDLSRSCSTRHCPWSLYSTTLTSAFSNITLDYAVQKKNPKYVGFRLMYDHVPLEYRDQFALYLQCNNVTVLHFVRDATVLSFWTLQARMMDTIFYGEYIDDSRNKTIKSQLVSNRFGIVLDPTQTRRYVDTIENNRQGYRRLFHLYPGAGRRLKYMEVSYEDLTGMHGSEYWKMVSTFLEFEKPVTVKNSGTFQKLHPGTCQDKIINWNEIKKALQGTETLQACLAME